jgi:hypothetical protein
MDSVFGLIIEGRCIALRHWNEICQKIYGPIPQFHDFAVSSELIEKKYQIKPVVITWE